MCIYIYTYIHIYMYYSVLYIYIHTHYTSKYHHVKRYRYSHSDRRCHESHNHSSSGYLFLSRFPKSLGPVACYRGSAEQMLACPNSALLSRWGGRVKPLFREAPDASWPSRTAGTTARTSTPRSRCWAASGLPNWTTPNA